MSQYLVIHSTPFVRWIKIKKIPKVILLGLHILSKFGWNEQAELFRLDT